MDASSGVAVRALDPSPADHVLDLCCAPGAKLCFIYDWMHHYHAPTGPPDEQGAGSITGVDISPPRLGSCKTLLKKYDIQHTRLFLTDAGTFDVKAPAPTPAPHTSSPSPPTSSTSSTSTSTSSSLPSTSNSQPQQTENPPPSHSSPSPEAPLVNDDTAPALQVDDVDTVSDFTEEVIMGNKRVRCDARGNVLSPDMERAQRKIKKKKQRQTRRGRGDDLPDLFFSNSYTLRCSNANAALYDKVIVDAECTLDGSIRHIVQHQKQGLHVHTQPEHIARIQHALIRNGFRLLRQGGVMVYATCSFSVLQNENIVQWLLDSEPAARVVRVDLPGPWTAGSLAHTLRFYPQDGTSGMFIAKIMKI